MRLSRLCLCASAAALLVVGCGQSKMVETTGKMRSLMLERNYQAALATLRQSKEKGSFKEQDRVVFWMNEGMLLHLMGQYAESNKVLNQAEQRSKELYTVSISKTMKAAITSDAAKDYAGEDYENVLVNVVKALNHLGQNNLEGAGVEARRINEKLAKLKTDYADKPFIYSQDAFAHWLSGVVLEAQRDNDAARIHYVKAVEAYMTDYAANYGMRVPSFVAEDAARMAALTGEEGVLNKLRAQNPNLGATAKGAKAMGKIVLIHMNGEGPSKTDYFIDCYFASIANWQCSGEPGGEFMKKTTITVGKGDTIKVAFPQLILRQPTHAGATLTVGGATAMTEVAEPISGIAAKVMRDKTGRIFRDAVIRVITKFLAAKASEEAGKAAGGALGGFLAKNAASVTMQAFEEADKRAWITLPSRIEVAEVMVPPGVYNVGVALVGGGSPPPIQGVKVEAGKTVFLTSYTLP